MSEEEEFDPFELHQEIEAAQKEFNKKFRPLNRGASPDDIANAFNRMASEMGGTIFSVLRDLAFQQGQLFVNQSGATDEDEPEEGIEPDNAKMFSDMLTFCEQTIEASISTQSITDEQRQVFEHLKTTAASCRAWLSDNTFEEGEDAGDEEVDQVDGNQDQDSVQQ